MISRGDTARLLGLARGLGLGVEVDEPTVAAWSFLLNRHDVNAEQAQEALLKMHGFVSAQAVVDEALRATRRMPDQIARDVRSARNLELVDKDWPEDKPLTPELARKVDDYWTGQLEERKRIEAASEAPDTAALDWGIFLNGVEDA